MCMAPHLEHPHVGEDHPVGRNEPHTCDHGDPAEETREVFGLVEISALHKRVQQRMILEAVGVRNWGWPKSMRSTQSVTHLLDDDIQEQHHRATAHEASSELRKEEQKDEMGQV